MFSGGGKINIDYGWELTLFKQMRDFSDGITFFEEKLNWDKFKGDHSPKLEAHIILFNFTIIEFTVYYLHHRR